jgi:hypothetical protein
MLEIDVLKSYIDQLEGDSFARRYVLIELSMRPTGDEHLLPYLEKLLEDTTIILYGIPLIYGEIRWLAAEALATERAKLGIKEPVRLLHTFHPIRPKDALHLLQGAGIPKKQENIEDIIKNLIDLRLLPIIDRDFDPKRYI